MTSNNKWAELSGAASKHKERADCSVKALAVATGLDYDTCHAALKQAGRKNRGRCYPGHIQTAARSLGFKPSSRTIGGATLRTADQHCPIGVGAVVFVTGHFAGWDGTKIIDWMEGRKKHIKLIIDIRAGGQA